MGIRPAELDTISLRHSNHPMKCLRDMIHAWLQQHYKTRVMVYHLGGQAIHEEEGGDDPSLARKIAKEHGSKCVGLGT